MRFAVYVRVFKYLVPKYPVLAGYRQWMPGFQKMMIRVAASLLNSFIRMVLQLHWSRPDPAACAAGLQGDPLES